MIAGHNSFWNAGLRCGFWEFLSCTFFLGLGFLIAAFCLAEMTSTLPFAGGMYGFVRLTCGPYLGYVIGCIEAFQNISFTASLALFMSKALCYAIEGLNVRLSILFTAIFFYGSYWVNIQGGKTFWWTMSGVCSIAVVMLLMYILGNTAVVNMDDNDGDGVIQPARGVMSTADRVYTTLSCLPYASCFFVGMKMIPIAASEVDGSKKKAIPRGIILSFVVMLFFAVALICTISATHPGALASSEVFSPLAAGYSSIFSGLNKHQAVALSIPAYIATCLALVYVYSRQIRAMAQSRLFMLSEILARSWGENQTPRAATIFGSSVAFILIIAGYAGDEEVLGCLNNISMMMSFFVYLMIIICYVRFRHRFDRLPSDFRSPFGIYGACVGFFVFMFTLICMVAFQPPGLIVLGICGGFIVLVSIIYKVRVASQQGYSDDEKKTMFQGYVINFNRMQRTGGINWFGGTTSQQARKAKTLQQAAFSLKKKVAPMPATPQKNFQTSTAKSSPTPSATPSRFHSLTMKSTSCASLISSSSERNLSSKLTSKTSPQLAASSFAVLGRVVSNILSLNKDRHDINRQRLDVEHSLSSSQPTMQSATTVSSYYQGACIIEDDEDASPGLDEEVCDFADAAAFGGRTRICAPIGGRISHLPPSESLDVAATAAAGSALAFHQRHQTPTNARINVLGNSNHHSCDNSTRRYDSIHLFTVPSSEFTANVNGSGLVFVGHEGRDGGVQGISNEHSISRRVIGSVEERSYRNAMHILDISDARSPERSFHHITSPAATLPSPTANSIRRNLRIITNTLNSGNCDEVDEFQLERSLMSPLTQTSAHRDPTSADNSKSSDSASVSGGRRGAGLLTNSDSSKQLPRNSGDSINSEAGHGEAQVAHHHSNSNSLHSSGSRGSLGASMPPSGRKRTPMSSSARFGIATSKLKVIGAAEVEGEEDVIISGDIVMLRRNRVDDDKSLENEIECKIPTLENNANHFDDPMTQMNGGSISGAVHNNRVNICPQVVTVALHSNSDVASSSTSHTMPRAGASNRPTSSSLLRSSLNTLYRTLLPSLTGTTPAPTDKSRDGNELSARRASARVSARVSGRVSNRNGMVNAVGNGESSIRSARSALYQVQDASPVSHIISTPAPELVDLEQGGEVFPAVMDSQEEVQEERSIEIVSEFHQSSFPQLLEDDLLTAYLDPSIDQCDDNSSISSTDMV